MFKLEKKLKNDRNFGAPQTQKESLNSPLSDGLSKGKLAGSCSDEEAPPSEKHVHVHGGGITETFAYSGSVGF